MHQQAKAISRAVEVRLAGPVLLVSKLTEGVWIPADLGFVPMNRSFSRLIASAG
jgi:hypothetical protein